MDPIFWMMFEEKIESIKLIQQYPTGCSNRSNMLPEERIEPIKPIKLIPQYPTGCLNGYNILDDVWREDWTSQTHPTISNRDPTICMMFEENIEPIKLIQQGVQTDPTFWMMFEETIELIKLIQQYPTRCSNGSNIIDDVWRDDWTNQTHPTISNAVFKRIQHAGRCWKRRLNHSNLSNNIQHGVQTDPTCWKEGLNQLNQSNSSNSMRDQRYDQPR